MIDACVQAANKKGCCDAVGVLRGTLFLETEPMSMDQLVEETGYSKSTVSSNMNLLETLGLARRVVIPGDKRYHYVLVTDPDSLRKAMLVHIKILHEWMSQSTEVMALTLAGSGDRERALQLSRAVRERHYTTAGELLHTGLFTEFHADLEVTFDALDELLRGIAAVGELTPRTTDYVLSFDAYGNRTANIQIGLQSWQNNYFGGAQTVNATLNNALAAANTWQTFSVNLGTISGANPTGATWQLNFQLNSWEWGGPANTDTLVIDNVVLSIIPEPASVSLMGLGLAVLWFFRRNR